MYPRAWGQMFESPHSKCWCKKKDMEYKQYQTPLKKIYEQLLRIYF